VWVDRLSVISSIFTHDNATTINPRTRELAAAAASEGGREQKKSEQAEGKGEGCKEESIRSMLW